jgi:phosphatidate cytidylyltransferase
LATSGRVSTLSCKTPLCRRTVTALLLGPLVIGAILWLPTDAFAIFFGCVVLGGAWEWCALAGLPRLRHRVSYAVAVLIVMLGLWLMPAVRQWLVAVAVVWWAVQAVALFRVSAIEPKDGPETRLLPVGLLVLVGPWAALVNLHQQGSAGPRLVLFLVLMIWAADIAAYFVGRRFGRVKLAPMVSPGKTREGVYGALAAAFLGGLLLGWVESLGTLGILIAALVCAITVLLSVVGDLYESLLKRRRGLKDSSNLLPGHGGLLDRIDSVTAAAPVFALGIVSMGGIA